MHADGKENAPQLFPGTRSSSQTFVASAEVWQDIPLRGKATRLNSPMEYSPNSPSAPRSSDLQAGSKAQLQQQNSSMDVNTGSDPSKESQEITKILNEIGRNLMNVERTWGVDSQQSRDAAEATQDFLREIDGMYKQMDRMLEETRRMRRDGRGSSEMDVDSGRTTAERTIEQFLADLQIS
ncbi:hypothetical protein LTS15_005449 [Exophiala xenobiotica]|nr:hypothetical protein LTS15_005449 [Exophiala xenobiotica]